MPPATTLIDIGIFAHNEAACISGLINQIKSQDIFTDPRFDLRVMVIANGCTDDTAKRAQAAAGDQPGITVHNLDQGGKSRSMNRFIHHLARPDCTLVGFMDADIHLTDNSLLRRMAQAMIDRPELHVHVSKPVKDIELGLAPAGVVGRMIAMGGGGLTDFRTAICGQLFMLRGPVARGLRLPIGLPVEDGFIRAMVLTDHLTRPEDLGRIDGDDSIFHVYESIQTIPELLRHQTRIVVGSAVNTALFTKIRREAHSLPQAQALLDHGTQDATWLANVLRHELPHRPYGWVPFAFLLHRVNDGKWRRILRRGPKGIIITAAGLTLDGIVYLRATWRMMTGGAAGHW